MHDESPPTQTDATGEDPDEHASRVGKLRQMAKANEAATWGDAERAKLRVPGIVSGEVGPKGKVSSQLREQSRVERATSSEVPFGATTPGSAHLVLLPLLLIAVGLLGAVALLVWWAW
ncbi:MAG: hypothetical protein JWN41_617 [Thermoleophilia bacterium]|nr:hypothetical protein [Thermoleophilia bacterium]